jgi:hypothetical protein
MPCEHVLEVITHANQTHRVAKLVELSFIVRYMWVRHVTGKGLSSLHLISLVPFTHSLRNTRSNTPMAERFYNLLLSSSNSRSSFNSHLPTFTI